MRDLILLHGALGCKEQLEPLDDGLSAAFRIHRFNFAGHGGEPLTERFSIPVFGEQLRRYITAHSISRALIFGYSMGGYIALWLARHHPELVDRVATLATKFGWNTATAEREANMLDPLVMEQKVPGFAASLRKMHHPENWKNVVAATAGMMRDLGEHPVLQNVEFASISTPVLLMLGDRDKMVSIEETSAVYRQLPQSQLCILPSTSHPVEQVDVPLLTLHLQRYFTAN
ncbi:MAG TPA: alpha/beta fold hydrolase [Chitinophagaceae bacterium]